MATAPLRRCWDLTEAHIQEALGDRKGMGKLLKELATVAKPNSGAPKILIAVARLAKPTCEWIEGNLRVEITGDDIATTIKIMEDLGGGIRELVFPRLTLAVPFAEIERSVRLAPRAIEPLDPITEGEMLALVSKKSRPSRAPPPFEIAEDSIRRSLPPSVRKSIAPAPVLKARPKPPPPLPSGSIQEMPRLPKILDFGDLLTNEKRSKRPPPRR